MSSFIIVQNDNDYTHNACKIIGVYNSELKATIKGWLFLIDHLSMPWNIKHYQEKREGCGVGDFHIEEWDITSSEHRNTWRLGWNIVPPYHKSLIDKHLKDLVNKGVDHKRILLDWKILLLNNQIPEDIGSLTIRV